MLFVHTSDMHGKLTAEKAVKLFYFKKQGAILLDSGDALSAGNLDVRWRERTLSLMSSIGYDAGAIGNREFHPFPLFLKWKLRDSSFPHLSANLQPREKLAEVKPFIMIEKGNQKIAIIGLTLPQIKSFWEKVLPFRFSEPITEGVKLSGELKDQCDYIVFLTHMGLARDIELAKALKVHCLILGGHNHTKLTEPMSIGNCYIMHSGCYARNFAIIEVDKGKVKGWLEKL
ncbi:metallophosphoesterase [bacterium]|nr:metallophosphoesterase [bacterium]